MYSLKIRLYIFDYCISGKLINNANAIDQGSEFMRCLENETSQFRPIIN